MITNWVSCILASLANRVRRRLCMLQFLHVVFVVSVSRTPSQLKPAYFVSIMKLSGRYSVVVIETDNGLDGPWFESRWVARLLYKLSVNICCSGYLCRWKWSHLCELYLCELYYLIVNTAVDSNFTSIVDMCTFCVCVVLYRYV
jgi:hypothetical protein